MNFGTALNKELALWLALSLAFSLFFKSLWQDIDKLFSPAYIQTTGAYPWAVLLLCAVWIYIKRGEILQKMDKKTKKPVFILTGIAAVFASLALQLNGLPFQVFAFLLSSLGLFFIFFGEAAAIPAVLLGVYGFTIAFPIIFSKFLEVQYSFATVKTVAAILNTFGYPINAQGQILSFSDTSGRSIAAFIGAPSSGIASITIFAAIFVLMMLDAPLPARRAAYMFLFGLVGTSLQNVLRLVFLILAGYHYGPAALSAAHDYAGYIIFPAWFALFVFIYLKVQRE